MPRQIFAAVFGISEERCAPMKQSAEVALLKRCALPGCSVVELKIKNYAIWH